MGAAGTDAALETADVALMADELLKIPYVFRLSRAAVRNIKVNLAISLVMKAAFVALAVAGMATLWMAVVADTGASIIVIANALRLAARRLVASPVLVVSLVVLCVLRSLSSGAGDPFGSTTTVRHADPVDGLDRTRRPSTSMVSPTRGRRPSRPSTKPPTVV